LPQTIVFSEKVTGDALQWAKGRRAMADVLIKPILESEIVNKSDDELKRHYDEFRAIMKDPEKREEIRKSFEEK
jgi:hypothetical protein